jgi:hypothetical protein
MQGIQAVSTVGHASSSVPPKRGVAYTRSGDPTTFWQLRQFLQPLRAGLDGHLLVPNIAPEPWRLLYSLRPTVGVIGAFRWCILAGQNELNGHSFFCDPARVSSETERNFVDLI